MTGSVWCGALGGGECVWPGDWEEGEGVDAHCVCGSARRDGEAAEGEWVLSPNMRFVVTKPRHRPLDGPLVHSWVVEMQQIPDQTLWS